MALKSKRPHLTARQIQITAADRRRSPNQGNRGAPGSFGEVRRVPQDPALRKHRSDQHCWRGTVRDSGRVCGRLRDMAELSARRFARFVRLVGFRMPLSPREHEPRCLPNSTRCPPIFDQVAHCCRSWPVVLQTGPRTSYLVAARCHVISVATSHKRVYQEESLRARTFVTASDTVLVKELDRCKDCCCRYSLS